MTVIFKRKNILPKLLALYLAEMVFFILGMVLNKILFFGLLGKPEEMGWLFFMFTSAIFGLVFVFIVSIVGTVVIYSKAKKSGVPSPVKHALLCFVSSLFLFFLSLVIFAKVTPPCPNCVR